MLTISDLIYKIDNRLLFDKASVVLPAGSKTGFVGRNGSGKTTLFRLIMHEIIPDEGDIEVHPKARIGTVPQEAPASDDSVLDMVLSADRERDRLLREAEQATDGHRIAEIHARLVDIDAHSAEARASSVLRGLGFGHERQKPPCSELSGGWRMRVALAGVLFAKPDLLLLDEPTNYLDLEGTLWLESYLASYPYTVLMISHDRGLLNRAVTSIIHLDQGKLSFYRGNYDTFENTRRLQRELAGKTREKALERIAHLQSFVDRFRYKESKAKQAQARIKMIDKMRPPEALNEEAALPFSFPNPKRAMASPMLDFEDVSVGYTGEPVLKRLNLRIEPDDRIALVGINGNGKSTFAKLIAGELKPMDGKIRRGRGFQTAYFAQHQLELLKPKWNALQHVEELMWDSTDAQRRSRVARIGLSTQKMETPAENLSGGERARLLMGLIAFTGPSMLILDEPTNHLDIDSRDALVAALNDYEGAVLIISHDRHLIEATADQIWIAENGTIRPFDGDMESYEKRLLAGTQNSGGSQKNGAGSTSDRRAQRQAAAERRALLAPLRKEVRRIEDKMARLGTELNKIENRLADPRLYEGHPDEAIRLGKDKARFAAEIEKLEEDWLVKSAELEQAEAAQAEEAQ